VKLEEERGNFGIAWEMSCVADAEEVSTVYIAGIR